uniref:Uncharacterized protein n=1 Tax=Lepeophtheirus salmonis TaxID=72036 RepID=A0A0K2TV10_LEPSM
MFLLFTNKSITLYFLFIVCCLSRINGNGALNCDGRLDAANYFGSKLLINKGLNDASKDEVMKRFIQRRRVLQESATIPGEWKLDRSTRRTVGGEHFLWKTRLGKRRI